MFDSPAYLIMVMSIVIFGSITAIAINDSNNKAELEKFAIEHQCERLPDPNSHSGKTFWGNCKK